MQSSIDVKVARPRWRPSPLCWGIALLGLCGCAGFWDDITSHDFRVKTMFSKPDPLTVLKESTDGHRRGQALGSLKEPPPNDEQHEFYVKLLTEAATNDREPLCRLGAIRALASYKDPRAVKALEDVYLQNLRFTPEINSTIRMQALASLQSTGNPEARHLLIRVARQPGGGTESSMADRQQTNDERLTAIRGLARYKDPETVETLVHVLETDKDVALNQRAWESLKTCTGKNLPKDPVQWRAMIDNKGDAVAKEPGMWNKFFKLAGN